MPLLALSRSSFSPLILQQSRPEHRHRSTTPMLSPPPTSPSATPLASGRERKEDEQASNGRVRSGDAIQPQHRRPPVPNPPMSGEQRRSHGHKGGPEEEHSRFDITPNLIVAFDITTHHAWRGERGRRHGGRLDPYISDNDASGPQAPAAGAGAVMATSRFGHRSCVAAHEENMAGRTWLLA